MKATVQLYHDRRDDYEDVEPDVEHDIQLTRAEDCGFDIEKVDRQLFAVEKWDEVEDVHNHKYYAIDVECDETVILYVHTNTSVHGPEWGRAVEGGLKYAPDDDYPPFGCELWGEVRMWVKEVDE